MFHHSLRDLLENPAAVAVAGFLLIALYQRARQLSLRAIEETGAGKPFLHYLVLVLLQLTAMGFGLYLLWELAVIVLGSPPERRAAGGLAVLAFTGLALFTAMTLAWSRRDYATAAPVRPRRRTQPVDHGLPDAHEILARAQRRDRWLGLAHAVLLGLLLGGGYLGWEAWRDTTLSARELAERIPAQAPLPVTFAAGSDRAFKVVRVMAQQDDLRFIVRPLRVPRGLDTRARMAWAADIGYGDVCRLLEPFRRAGIDKRLQVSREVYDSRGELMASTQGDIGACIAYTRAR